MADFWEKSHHLKSFFLAGNPTEHFTFREKTVLSQYLGTSPPRLYATGGST